MKPYTAMLLLLGTAIASPFESGLFARSCKAHGESCGNFWWNDDCCTTGVQKPMACVPGPPFPAGTCLYTCDDIAC